MSTECPICEVSTRIGCGCHEGALPSPASDGYAVRIIEPACGDHPALILARKGDKGTVAGESKTFGYSVKWDNWQSAAFRAKLGVDFEVIPRVLP